MATRRPTEHVEWRSAAFVALAFASIARCAGSAGTGSDAGDARDAAPTRDIASPNDAVDEPGIDVARADASDEAQADTGLDAPDAADARARDAGDAGVDVLIVPHAFDIGMQEWESQFAPFAAFRAAEHAGPREPRICHASTYWDIAQSDPGVDGGLATHHLPSLIAWMNYAERYCDEVLITFQGNMSSVLEAPPAPSTYRRAIVAFMHLTDPGQPLAAWRGRLAFTAWNEPDNYRQDGNGLQNDLSPELAADYYMVLRSECRPATGCRVAAGDFASTGGMTWHTAVLCADDDDPRNTPTHCATPSSHNPSDRPPSYLDRYKIEIVQHAIEHGLPAGFRPEYWAFHGWGDVTAYIASGAQCTTYDNCNTRRLIESMSGTWRHVELWDTEAGAGQANDPAPDPNTTQPCGAVFLVQMTELDRRITRLYYMNFTGENGPLYDGTTMRPAGHVMADRATSYSGAHCARTGM